MSARTLVAIGLGLTLGNFVYEAFAGQNFASAFEWSYAQAGALLTVYLCKKFWSAS